MIDQQLAEFLFEIRSPMVVSTLLLVSKLGGAVGITTISLIASLVLGYQKKYRQALGLIVAVAGSALTMATIKFFVDRPRPVGLAAVSEDFSSFPSGHATAAAALYGFLIYLLWLTGRPKTTKIVGTIDLSILILLIGFSRLYLGVHFLTDVLAGFALGAAWISIGIRVSRIQQ